MTRSRTGIWEYDAEPPLHGERLTIAWLTWALNTLGKLACPPHPRSRFPESLRYIRDCHANPSLVDQPEVRMQLAEIQRATWELMLIVKATIRAERSTSPFTRDKLQEMFGGALAADDSHARNIQFELYVAALFVIGKFTVRRGDPDAQVEVYGEYLGIEAKRMSSSNPDTIRRMLSRAARQVTGKSTSPVIEIVRSRGFLALNLDGLFESIDSNGEKADLAAQFGQRMNILDQEARVLGNKTGVVGVLATGHVARWSKTDTPSHWSIETLYAFRWLGLHGDDPVDESLTKRFAPQIDRLQDEVLRLRDKVPKAIRVPLPPAP